MSNKTDDNNLEKQLQEKLNRKDVIDRLFQAIQEDKRKIDSEILELKKQLKQEKQKRIRSSIYKAQYILPELIKKYPKYTNIFNREMNYHRKYTNMKSDFVFKYDHSFYKIQLQRYISYLKDKYPEIDI